jgi:hypothetical protein
MQLYEPNPGAAFLDDFLFTTVLINLLISHIIIPIENALDIALATNCCLIIA